jgi:hypothetical protein
MIGYLDNLIIADQTRYDTNLFDTNYISGLAHTDISTNTYYDTGVQTILTMENTIGAIDISENNIVLSSGDGQRGGAAYFDGQIDTNIQISNLPIMTGITVSFRVKTDENTKNIQIFMSQ